MGVSGVSRVRTGFSGPGNFPGKAREISVDADSALLFFENGLVLGGFDNAELVLGHSGG